MKKKLLFYIIIINIIYFSSSLIIDISKRKNEFCFYKNIEYEDDTLVFNYLISSSNKEELEVSLHNLDTNKMLYHKRNEQKDEFKLRQISKGTFKLCFFPRNRNLFQLTFDFYSFKESGIIKSLADENELVDINKGVNVLRKKYIEFEKNMKFLTDRKSKHSDILSELMNNVKKLTFFKIFIIFIISIFQILLIMNLFKNDKRVKKIEGAFQEGL
jgi:hypothetical protein